MDTQGGAHLSRVHGRMWHRPPPVLTPGGPGHSLEATHWEDLGPPPVRRLEPSILLRGCRARLPPSARCPWQAPAALGAQGPYPDQRTLPFQIWRPTCLWSRSHSQCCLHQEALLTCSDADKNQRANSIEPDYQSLCRPCSENSGHVHFTGGKPRLGTGSRWPKLPLSSRKRRECLSLYEQSPEQPAGLSPSSH